MIRGHATEEGTAAYARTHTATGNGFRSFGKTGLTTGPVGFGGYRIHPSDETHAEALSAALLRGSNLIDTSSNYTDGGSETLIGHVLQELISKDKLKREQVVVVSKVGYMQGENLRVAEEREKAGRPFPEVVPYMDGCWHCLHPDFLEDQLQRSLARLGLDCIDVYLLHNPEYYLGYARKKQPDSIATLRKEYYRRIRQAFEWLDQQARAGRISGYGISSNTFPSAADDPEATSLEDILKAAGEMGPSSHFTALQLPMNLFESGGWTRKNQRSGTVSVLELARENGIGVLINRPLNAITGNAMIRLADFPTEDEALTQNRIQKALQSVVALEQEFSATVWPQVAAMGIDERASTAFSLAGELKDHYASFENLEHWTHVAESMVWPRFSQLAGYLDQATRGHAGWREWARRYGRALGDLTEAISQLYSSRAQVRSVRITQELEDLDPETKTSSTLSQKAIRALTSMPGVSCVLVGMRRPAYVTDSLTVLSQPPFHLPAKLFEQSDRVARAAMAA
ncbi:MAG: aldo/keto reductase [Nitrospirae bacterium]|nr:aldo/keto reductase [Nitrospirota bacterium]